MNVSARKDHLSSFGSILGLIAALAVVVSIILY